MKWTIVFFLVTGILFSCNNTNTNSDVTSVDLSEEAMLKARLIFTTPDSLLSSEEKVLFTKLEESMWNGVSIKDYGYALQYEIIVSREEWIKKGLPEIYFEIIRQDIACSNEGLLDTIMFPKQLILDAFYAKQTDVREKQAERIAQK